MALKVVSEPTLSTRGEKRAPLNIEQEQWIWIAHHAAVSWRLSQWRV
jgi:hypothetical protein